MRFSIFQESRIGGRKSNQDRMGYCYTRDALLMVLADGMGGHVQGDMAAQLALQTIGTEFQKTAAPTLRHPLHFLQDAIEAAHGEIVRYRALHRLADSPRTTIVACVVQNGYAWWAHVGDSRLYWMRGGAVLAQTRDHSRVQVLVDQKLITPAEALVHPDRNKVFNWSGSPEQPRVELSRKMRLLPGDTLLLCSDGLWAMSTDAELARAFASQTVMRAVPDLVAAALSRAGPTSDNVTALAMTWEGGNPDLTAGTEVSTLALPAGTMTTSIQRADPALPVGELAPLTDEEIERTIREIRESIRKSKQGSIRD